MTILNKLLSEIKSDDNTEQIRILCDKIAEEEKKNVRNGKLLPKGPNIFLSLEVPGRNSKELAFLTLERESEDKYLSVLYTIPTFKLAVGDEALKRRKVWPIDDHRAQKVLSSFAKTYKFLRGE